MTLSPATTSYAYKAQGLDGQPFSGTLDAADAASAQRQLEGLRLRVLEIAPAAAPARPARLRGEDFVAFNQQLAQLTAAGMPLEHGLRLVAEDLRRGRMADAVRQVAADLEAGTPLPDALARHGGQFPSAYAALVEAGVKSNNLPGVLLNLGKHLVLVGRLRAAVWRAAGYPLMVLAAFAVVMTFLFLNVVPQFRALFADFKADLPPVTQFLLLMPGVARVVLIFGAVALAVLAAGWWLAKRAGVDRVVVDRVVLRLPLVGPVLRRNLLARWCDLVRLGVEAGLDLPASIRLASDAAGSPTLKSDGDALVAALEAGRPLAAAPPGRLLPATVAAAIELSGRDRALARTLDNLARMYEQQTEVSLAALQSILPPLLLLMIAVLVGFVVIALFAPLLSLLRAISAPMFASGPPPVRPWWRIL